MTWNENRTDLQRHLGSHTVSILLLKGQKIVGRGSGTLVEYRDQTFVATCRHLFTVRDSERVILLNSPCKGRNFVETQDVLPLTSAIFEPNLYDPTDVAFIPIADPTPLRAQGCQFFPLQRLPSFKTQEFTTFLCGSPGQLAETSWQAVTDDDRAILGADTEATVICSNLGRQITLQGTFIVEPPLQDNGLLRCCVEPAIEIVDGDQFFHTPGDVGGMSGGGLWMLDQEERARLVGILIVQDWLTSEQAKPFCSNPSRVRFPEIGNYLIVYSSHINNWIDLVDRKLNQGEVTVEC